MEFPVVAQLLWAWLIFMRIQVWFLAFLSGLRIRHGHELWCRSQMRLDPEWLRRRLAAVAPSRPLAWELPYAAGAALRGKKKKVKSSLCDKTGSIKRAFRGTCFPILFSTPILYMRLLMCKIPEPEINCFMLKSPITSDCFIGARERFSSPQLS